MQNYILTYSGLKKKHLIDPDSPQKSEFLCSEHQCGKIMTGIRRRLAWIPLNRGEGRETMKKI